MSAQEMLAETFRQPFSDRCDRYAGSIGADNAGRFPHRIDAFHQLALNLQVFDDDLDDPICLADHLEIIFQVPDFHQAA